MTFSLNHPMKITHLSFLTVCFVVIQYFYESSSVCFFALLSFAIITELLPHKAFREVMTPISLVASFYLIDFNGDYLDSWARMAVVYLVLIPSRRQALDVLTILISLELLYVGYQSNTPNDYLIWLPIAIAALGFNAWLSVKYKVHHHMRVRHLHRKTIWAQVGKPIAWVVCLSLFVASICISAYPSYDVYVPGEGNKIVNHPFHEVDGFEFEVNGQYDPWTSVGEELLASMEFKEEKSIDNKTYYLRAATLPYLKLVDKRWSWQLGDNNTVLEKNRQILHENHKPQKIRVKIHKIISSSVLMPDGCAEILPFDRLRDSHHNFYFTREGIRQSYVADLGSTSYPIQYYEMPNVDTYTEIDPLFREKLMSRVHEFDSWTSLSPQEAAEAIQIYLTTHNLYTLDVLRAENEEEDGGLMLSFIAGPREYRRGCCQQFASALCLLMRALGHPSRVVVGFASNEINKQHVVFRERNGHAWSEYQMDGKWHRIDATPPDSWNERSLENELKDIDEDVLETSHDAPEGWQVGSALLTLVLIGVGIFYFKRHRHNLEHAPEKSSAQPDDIIKLCHQLNIPVKRSSTISQLIEQVQSKIDTPLDDAHALYLQIRYGGQPGQHKWPDIDL